MAKTIQWKHVKLGEVAEFRNGVNYNRESFGTGVKVVGVKDFQDYSKPKYDSLEEINPEGVVTSKSILRDGDIVFVRSNGNRELIGRSLFIDRPTEEVTHSAFTIRVRFNAPEFYPKFYSYFFRTSAIRKGLTAHGGGTNISNLNQDILSGLEIPVPDLPTQRKIASIPSAYDDLIENNLHRIKILEEMAQSLYREWFVHFRFPGHESVPLVDSSLGSIPKGWDVKKLGGCTSYLGRGLAPKYDESGQSVVINQKCIRSERLTLDQARRQSKPIPQDKLIRRGDVLVNSTGVGTLGRVAQVEFDPYHHTVDTHVTIVRPKPEVDSSFFGQALFALQETFDRLGAGATGQTELSRTSIAEVGLVIPPSEMQKKYGSLVTPIREAANTHRSQNKVLRQTRDLLLPKLLGAR